MPIKDGTTADQYHSENRMDVTRRIRTRIAESGIRSADPHESVLKDWRGAPKVHLNFHRAAYDLYNVPSQAAARMVRGLSLDATKNVLFIGAGFGWTVEHLKKMVPGISVTCTEPGAWIQQVKETDERGDIEAALDVAGVTDGILRDRFMGYLDQGPRAVETLLQEDTLSNNSRNKLRQNGPYSHIITEHVLQWLWDDEAANLSDALRMIDSQALIYHRLTPYRDEDAGELGGEPEPQLNWKRVEDNRPVIKRLLDQPKYIESDWKVLLPNDGFIY